MKKFWSYVLTIYVTIVTIGCAVFATLYFVKLGAETDNTKTLSYTEAKALVHQVYETQITNATGNSIAANAQYSDYNEEDFDYTFVSMPYATYKKSLQDFEMVFANNIAPDTWTDSSNYTLSLNDGKFRITIVGQTVSFEFTCPTKSVVDDTNTVHPGDNFIMLRFTVTKKSEDSWSVNYYDRYYASTYETSTPDINDYRFTFYNFSFEAENNELFYMGLNTAVTKLKVLKDDLSESDFYGYMLYECNLKTHKILMQVGPEDAYDFSDFTYCQNISKTEALTAAQKTYNDQKDAMGLYYTDAQLA